MKVLVIIIVTLKPKFNEPCHLTKIVQSGPSMMAIFLPFQEFRSLQDSYKNSFTLFCNHVQLTIMVQFCREYFFTLFHALQASKQVLDCNPQPQLDFHHYLQL